MAECPAVMSIAPIVIHAVVASGPDWTTVLAAAVAGATGIIGALWQGKRSANAANKNLLTTISADDKRTEISEKRRLYANFHTALDRLFTATTVTNANRHKVDPAQIAADMQIVREAVYNAVSELRLAAPQSIGEQLVRHGREPMPSGARGVMGAAAAHVLSSDQQAADPDNPSWPRLPLNPRALRKQAALIGAATSTSQCRQSC